MAVNFLPYHGLWQDAAIALPGGAHLPAPDPNRDGGNGSYIRGGEGFGNALLVKVPGQPLTERTVAAAARDAAAGRQWLNYALQSGARGQIGSAAINADTANNGRFIYIDAARKRWLVEARAQTGAVATLYVRVRRFGHFDRATHAWSAQTTRTTDNGGAPFSPAPMVLCARKSDGSVAIFGAMDQVDFGTADALTTALIENGQQWPSAFFQLTVGGLGQEGLPDCGLALGWALLKPFPAGSATYQTDYVWDYKILTGQEIRNLDENNSGTFTITLEKGALATTLNISNCSSDYHRQQTSVSIEVSDLWPVFDQTDALQWLTFERRRDSSSDVTRVDSYTNDIQTFVDGVQTGWQHATIQTTRTTANSVVDTWTLRLGATVIDTLSYTWAQPGNGTVVSNLTSTYVSISHYGSPTGFPLCHVDGNTNYYNEFGPPPAGTSSVSLGTFDSPVTWGAAYAATEPRGFLAPVRYSAQLFGAFTATISGPVGSLESVTNARLKDAAAPGAYASFNVPAPANSARPHTVFINAASGRFGTWHPVTGEIAFGSSPVCWV